MPPCQSGTAVCEAKNGNTCARRSALRTSASGVYRVNLKNALGQIEAVGLAEPPATPD